MAPLLTRVASVFQRFLRWWLGELAALVPERVRATLAPKREVVLVELVGPEITVARVSRTERRELARLPRPDRVPAGQAPPPPSLPRRQLAAAGEVVLRLPAEAALRKTVSLPLAAEANLREILYFELDRQTPFRPDEVYFDHHVRERLPGAQRIVVELTVLARAAVEPVLRWLGQAGLEPVRVEGVPASPDGESWTCRLPLREEAGGAGAGERAPVTRYLNPGLAALALILAATAVYLPVMRQQALLADLQAELAVEKRKADETLALKETLAALSEEALYVVNRKRTNPSVLEVWDEVTRVMPDHSFALELRLRQGQVELVGQSEAATGLLDVVEGSPLFHRANFRSPITRGRGGEAERFHLAFEVRPRGAPATQQQQTAAER